MVRCEIGTASTVARQIDNLNHTDVVGTLAGDDTFLIILGDAEKAHGDEALRRPSPRGLARRHSSARTPALACGPAGGYAAPAALTPPTETKEHRS